MSWTARADWCVSTVRSQRNCDQIGQMPLPPYIHERLQDPERYQTVYSQETGSAAAPTAGLHFTPGLMEELRRAGIGLAEVTLHVGLDTFAPVKEEDVHRAPHPHRVVPVEPRKRRADQPDPPHGGRVMAVGTTSVRTLESAAARSENPGEVVPFEGQTDLYILPGYQFKVVDAMVTNFHLPRSTLLMLVSAFAGREKILSAYQEALEESTGSIPLGMQC